MRDPHKVLGVPRNADAEAIKRAYRLLAGRLHPDRNPGNPKAEERFKELVAAYRLLSDPGERVRRDHRQSGAGRTRKRRNASSQDAPPPEHGATADLKPAGPDLAYELALDFLEAVVGCTKRIRLANGRRIDVRVPPGTVGGQRLRLRGQGSPGVRGCRAGDAFVTVAVEPHRVFSRDGFDVRSTLAISLPEAVLGCRVEVPTIHGPVTLDIPPGVNTDTVLRLKGKGVARPEGPRGDQLLTLKVVLPRSRDSQLVEFVERWSKENGYTVRRHAADPG